MTFLCLLIYVIIVYVSVDCIRIKEDENTSFHKIIVGNFKTTLTLYTRFAKKLKYLYKIAKLRFTVFPELIVT